VGSNWAELRDAVYPDGYHLEIGGLRGAVRPKVRNRSRKSPTHHEFGLMMIVIMLADAELLLAPHGVGKQRRWGVIGATLA